MFVVVVTREYPPNPSVGGARAYWLATGLRQLGHRVLVVTAEPSARHEGVDTAVIPFRSAGAAAKRLAGIPPEQNAAVRAAARGWLAETVTRWSARTLERAFLYPDKYRAWIRASEDWLAENRDLIASADVVIASSPPASAAFVGLRLARAGSRPLVLDFRDPWTGNRHYPFGVLRRYIDSRAERRICSMAAAIVVASDGMTDRVLVPAPVHAHVIRTVPPARPDSREAPAYGHGAPFRLAFYGSTYEGQRDLRPILRAVESLLARDAIAPGSVEIEFAGALDQDLLRAIAESPARKIIKVLGTVPKETVDRRLMDAHIALCPMWPRDTEMLPFKLIEYLVAGREVLVTGSAETSDLRRALLGAEGVTFADTQQAIEASLAESIGRWSSGDPLYRPNRASLPWLSHEFFVARYADLLRDVSNQRTEQP